jgi:hypothetical protein
VTVWVELEAGFTTDPASLYSRAVPHKYDYMAMEREYVTVLPAKSMRQIALDHGVESGRVSSVSYYAKQHGWVEKREAYQNRTEDKIYEKLAINEAERQLKEIEVKDNAIALIDEAIAAARAGIAERHHVREIDKNGQTVYVERPKHPVTVTNVVNLIDRLDRMFGVGMVPPSEGSTGGFEDIAQQLGAGGGNIDVLALFARHAASRSGPPEPRRVASSSSADPADTGED